MSKDIKIDAVGLGQAAVPPPKKTIVKRIVVSGPGAKEYIEQRKAANAQGAKTPTVQAHKAKEPAKTEQTAISKAATQAASVVSVKEIQALLKTQQATGQGLKGDFLPLPKPSVTTPDQALLKSFAGKLGTALTSLTNLTNPAVAASGLATLNDLVPLESFSIVQLMTLLIQMQGQTDQLLNQIQDFANQVATDNAETHYTDTIRSLNEQHVDLDMTALQDKAFALVAVNNSPLKMAVNAMWTAVANAALKAAAAALSALEQAFAKADAAANGTGTPAEKAAAQTKADSARTDLNKSQSTLGKAQADFDKAKGDKNTPPEELAKHETSLNDARTKYGADLKTYQDGVKELRTQAGGIAAAKERGKAGPDKPDGVTDAQWAQIQQQRVAGIKAGDGSDKSPGQEIKDLQDNLATAKKNLEEGKKVFIEKTKYWTAVKMAIERHTTLGDKQTQALAEAETMKKLADIDSPGAIAKDAAITANPDLGKMTPDQLKAVIEDPNASQARKDAAQAILTADQQPPTAEQEVAQKIVEAVQKAQAEAVSGANWDSVNLALGGYTAAASAANPDPATLQNAAVAVMQQMNGTYTGIAGASTLGPSGQLELAQQQASGRPADEIDEHMREWSAYQTAQIDETRSQFNKEAAGQAAADASDADSAAKQDAKAKATVALGAAKDKSEALKRQMELHNRLGQPPGQVDKTRTFARPTAAELARVDALTADYVAARAQLAADEAKVPRPPDPPPTTDEIALYAPPVVATPVASGTTAAPPSAEGSATPVSAPRPGSGAGGSGSQQGGDRSKDGSQSGSQQRDQKGKDEVRAFLAAKAKVDEAKRKVDGQKTELDRVYTTIDQKDWRAGMHGPAVTVDGKQMTPVGIGVPPTRVPVVSVSSPTTDVKDPKDAPLPASLFGTYQQARDDARANALQFYPDLSQLEAKAAGAPLTLPVSAEDTKDPLPTDNPKPNQQLLHDTYAKRYPAGPSAVGVPTFADFAQTEGPYVLGQQKLDTDAQDKAKAAGVDDATLKHGPFPADADKSDKANKFRAAQEARQVAETNKYKLVVTQIMQETDYAHHVHEDRWPPPKAGEPDYARIATEQQVHVDLLEAAVPPDPAQQALLPGMPPPPAFTPGQDFPRSSEPLSPRDVAMQAYYKAADELDRTIMRGNAASQDPPRTVTEADLKTIDERADRRKEVGDLRGQMADLKNQLSDLDAQKPTDPDTIKKNAETRQKLTKDISSLQEKLKTEDADALGGQLAGGNGKPALTQDRQKLFDQIKQKQDELNKISKLPSREEQQKVIKLRKEIDDLRDKLGGGEFALKAAQGAVTGAIGEPKGKPPTATGSDTQDNKLAVPADVYRNLDSLSRSLEGIGMVGDTVSRAARRMHDEMYARGRDIAGFARSELEHAERLKSPEWQQLVQLLRTMAEAAAAGLG